MTRLMLAALALTLLAGCGLRGGLEKPPPMFGHEDEARTPPPPEQNTSQPPNATAEGDRGIGSHSTGSEVRTPSF